ncbi:hypothetical protein [Thalassotalea ganghwensis]
MNSNGLKLMGLNNIASISFIVVGIIALLTVIAHLSCIPLGENCYRAQLAPAVIIESAIEQTWLAPVGTIAISFIFFMTALYCFSAAKFVKLLPFTQTAIKAIAFICILRVTLTLWFSLKHPEKVTFFSQAAIFVWFCCGVLLIIGYRYRFIENVPKNVI